MFFRSRIIICKWGIVITSVTSILDDLVCFSGKKLLLCSSITSNVNKARIQKCYGLLKIKCLMPLTFHRTTGLEIAVISCNVKGTLMQT